MAVSVDQRTLYTVTEGLEVKFEAALGMFARQKLLEQGAALG